MVNNLLLLSGADIPFKEAQAVVHPPSIKEIGLIGEETFWPACQFITLDKEKLLQKDKNVLTDMSDFEVIMSIIESPNYLTHKNNVLMLLTLLFPDYKIEMQSKEIILLNENNLARINKTNFNTLQEIIKDIFDMSDIQENGYNPVDSRAKKIAEKIKKGKEKIAKSKEEDAKQISILNRYVSILAVGEHKDMNELLSYTVYQLKDEMKRFQLKQSFDMYIQAKMAGAKDLKEVDNWMDDIHS